MKKAKYEEKFIVINRKDLKHISEEGKANLDAIFKGIQVGRINDDKKALNNYYVCNQDEPYAKKVIEIILEGEDMKVNLSKSDKPRSVSELLCIIHGDGGHYIEEHGFDKAYDDAEEKVSILLAK